MNTRRRSGILRATMNATTIRLRITGLCKSEPSGWGFLRPGAVAICAHLSPTQQPGVDAGGRNLCETWPLLDSDFGVVLRGRSRLLGLSRGRGSARQIGIITGWIGCGLLLASLFLVLREPLWHLSSAAWSTCTGGIITRHGGLCRPACPSAHARRRLPSSCAEGSLGGSLAS